MRYPIRVTETSLGYFQAEALEAAPEGRVFARWKGVGEDSLRTLANELYYGLGMAEETRLSRLVSFIRNGKLAGYLSTEGLDRADFMRV